MPSLAKEWDTVRSRDKGDLGTAGLEDFIADIKKMDAAKEK